MRTYIVTFIDLTVLIEIKALDLVFDAGFVVFIGKAGAKIAAFPDSRILSVQGKED